MRVVFVSMDTLRADRLSCLGHPRQLTPNLDRIAGEGALFTQAFATDIPTQPSHTAMFTGRFGVNTGIVSHFHPRAQLDLDVPWLPTLMRDHGYATGAVDHLFAMKDWFVRGYDDYMPPPGRSRSPGSVINEIAFPWITKHADDDFFLFVHFWDAHIPYVPPSPHKERYTEASVGRQDPLINQKLRSRPTYPLFKQNLYDHLDVIPNLEYVADLYDAEVAYLDHEIGRLFNHLERHDLLDDTLVVLFGDHGEVMTEHDAWFDHAGLYDCVVHVPLILWAPGRVPVVRTDAKVALIDVLPTVVELLGQDPVPGVDGRSLLPLMRGETEGHRDAIMLSEATWQAKRGIRTEEWKFIRCYDPGVYPRAGIELYRLADDPDEQHDVAAEHPEVVAQMEALLDTWLDEQLLGRPDPMLTVIDDGLPAVNRLDGIINGSPETPSAAKGSARRGGAVVAAGAVAAGAVVAGAVGESPASGALSPGGPGADARPTAEVPVVSPAAPAALHRGLAATGGIPSQSMTALSDPATQELAASAVASPDQAQRFAPRNPHVRRLRGPRGLIVGAIVLVALGLLAWSIFALLLSSPLQATGAVEPTDSAQLNMSSTGPITAISVQPGQVVRTGQVLATQGTGAAQLQLASDNAKLAADQQALALLQSPVSSAQVDELQAAVTTAQAKESEAQTKVDQDSATQNADVTADQSAVSAAQTQLNDDNEAYQGNLPNCQSSNPPDSCSEDKRAVQADQVALQLAQGNLQVAQATQQQVVAEDEAAVTEAAAEVGQAQAAEAAGSVPPTDSQIGAAQAAVAKDQAAIAADNVTLGGLVLRAPFAGVVAAVNATVGDVATPSGVRQQTTNNPVVQPSSSGIQLLPQGPQSQQSSNPQQTAPLIELNSLPDKIEVQVAETDITKIHVGQQATATMPAVPNYSLPVTVRRIEPTPVDVSGQTYFLVDLYPVHSLTASSGRSRSVIPKGLVGLTVDVSF